MVARFFAVAAWIVAAWPSNVRAQERGEEVTETQSYALPDTRATRGLWTSIDGHVAARRYGEAITELQTLIEDHRGDVLAGERPKSASGRTSQQLVHPGAASRARARLAALPLEAQRLYRERHESEARTALERARTHGDPRALSELARRWPLTESANRAWWALGDLELELGNEREALFAWGRALVGPAGEANGAPRTADEWKLALERATSTASAPPSGIEARARSAIRMLEEDDGRVVGTHTGASGPPPGRDAEAWPSPFPLPEHPFRSENLDLGRSGDTLLVSTSLRLFALNAYSGDLEWDGGEPAGWEEYDPSRRSELFEGVDLEASIIAPAATSHVAIAALQIPIAVARRDDRMFQQIKILTPIPERRLFAYDLATGAPLWDHQPPHTWDGEGGQFTDRMSVAGPPVVAGSRVIAPFCRMQGRIDCHVACVDAETGALLWSTDLISGQRELNMFGRPVHEFVAPPVVVVGDRVIALTQLGAVACLDLFTGEILWETVYDQLALPKARDFSPPRRKQSWRNAPPVVVGDTVIAAPVDSNDLIGLELASGSLVWSMPRARLEMLVPGPNVDLDLLIGASDDVVYLSGNHVVALQARGGLHRQEPNVLKWSFDDEDLRNRDSVRAVLCKDRIVVPTSSERVEIELTQGLKIADWPWEESHGAGRVRVDAGELFTISRTQVNGYFDWNALVDRARAQHTEKPHDLRAGLALAQLLESRGLAQWQRGRTEAARSALAEARTTLESLRAPQPASSAEPTAKARAGAGSGDLVQARLHSILRAEARVRAGLADGAGALEALREAAAIAPDALALRDTLLEELALLGQPPAITPRAEILDELERACSDLLMWVTTLPTEALALLNEDATGLPRYLPLARESSDVSAVEIPVGLWVLLERANASAAANDSAAEFVSLHAILARYDTIDLGTAPAGEIAADRIGALLRQGATNGYEPFEEQARAALAAATERQDHVALAGIRRLYPHSKASQVANDELLAWATESGETARVVEIVSSELPAAWRLADATPREANLCLRLAYVLGEHGNRELERELVRSLAELHPDVVSEVPAHQGKPLAELAAGIERWTPREIGPAVGRFDESGRSRASDDEWVGEHEILGELAGSGGNGARLLIARISPASQTAAVSAYGESQFDAPLWRTSLRWLAVAQGSGTLAMSRRVAYAQDRIVISTGVAVVGLDEKDGSRAWEWRPLDGGMRPTLVSVAAGVAVTVVRDGDDRAVLQALDARGGVELWNLEIGSGLQMRAPILASNRVVLLPASGGRKAAVLDLFTGRHMLELEIDAPVDPRIERDAWVEGDQLFLPWFRASGQRLGAATQIVAFDLVSGSVRWRLQLGDSGSETGGSARTLENVLQHGGRTYLVLRPNSTDEGRPASGQIVELSTSIGATAPLSNVKLADGDRVLGITPGTRQRVAAPLVFLLSARVGTTDSRLRCIDLESGELWIQGLQVDFDNIEATAPLPAISDTTVAVGYTTKRGTMGQPAARTQLAFYDRASGLARGERSLATTLGSAETVRLFAFGRSLIVRGRRAVEILE